MVSEDPRHEQTPAQEIPGIIAKPVVDFAAESRRRKQQPVHDGFILYFPDAICAVAEFSRINNEKHNPGQRLHWSKHKSNDHANCVARHLKDIGPDWDELDPESGRLHAEALAWRSMAMLQIVLEAGRNNLKPSEYLKKLAAEAK